MAANSAFDAASAVCAAASAESNEAAQCCDDGDSESNSAALLSGSMVDGTWSNDEARDDEDGAIGAEADSAGSADADATLESTASD